MNLLALQGACATSLVLSSRVMWSVPAAALELLLPNQPATPLQTPNWMDYIWPISWIQTILRVHRELVLSSGNTRWTWWQRCLPEVYTKFPWYHWPPEMEPIDTFWCDHRWYHSYQEECAILPGPLSISDGIYSISTMLTIQIRRCAN